MGALGGCGIGRFAIILNVNVNRRLLPVLILFPFAATFADTITNATDLGHCLMHADAPCGEFSLPEATVLHVVQISGNSSILTLEDPSGTVSVSYTTGPGRPKVRAGDILRLTGHMVPATQPAYYAIASVTTATLLRHGPEPQPVETDLRTVIGGSLDWRLVRVSGFIREAVRSDTNADWMHLSLCADGQLLNLAMPLGGRTPEDFEELVGATVSVTGIGNPQDHSNKLYQGRIFHCSGREAFRVINPRSGDPFDAPTIASLHYRTPNEIATLGLHRVSGRVITVWQGKHVLLRTSRNEPVELILADAVMPQVGSVVDAVGYPESNLFNIILTRARWRPGTDAVPPDDDPPTELDAKISTRHRISQHGTRVTLEGIVAHLPESDGDAMIVERNGELVNLDVSSLTAGQRAIEIGSRIRAKGIYLLEPDPRSSALSLPRIRNATIIVDATDGITVVAPPKWWTTGRLLSVIATLVCTVLTLALWVILLRRLAEKRGQALAAETIAHAETDLKVLERTRLAVDLHDVIAQNLTGIALELETAKRFSSDSKPELQQHLTVAAQSLRSCRQELRNCLWDLRSHALEEPDMDAAIRHTLPLHLKEVRFVLRFNVPRANFTDNSTHTILCIIRELAHNAVQHGKATLVKIAGCIENSQLLFSVQDNGCGFDPATCPDGAQGHFGLEGIRERIRPLHGTFTVTSDIGKGTRAVVTIPIRNPTNPS